MRATLGASRSRIVQHCCGEFVLHGSHLWVTRCILRLEIVVALIPEALSDEAVIA